MKMKCNKKCKESAHCGHYGEHEENSDCKAGCDNGAKCVPVSKTITKTITDERGKNYGRPLDHFPVTREMSNEWLLARYRALRKGASVTEDRKEQAIRHAVYMICDKLARAATNPMHKDNWDDIQGYARCAKMILGMEN